MESDKSQENQNSEETQHRENSNARTNQNESTHKPELKAEWTVHAQLVISRPTTTSSKTKGSRQDNRSRNAGDNPVEVVYKWSSDDYKNVEDDSNVNGNPPKAEYREHDSFRSATGCTGKLPSESGFSSSNASRTHNAPDSNTGYGTRCRSTCNIVLSAVADFIPPKNATIPEEVDPFVYNTTTSYTVLPDQEISDPATRQQSFSQNFTTAKILDLRDAFCQTSDTELKSQQLSPSAQSNSTTNPSVVTVSDNTRKKRKPYDFRRSTDSRLRSPPPPPDEGLTRSPSHTFKSVDQIGSPTESSFPKEKKSPRTVHIDVYCTGSDAEDENDNDHDEHEETSTESTESSENPNELESNSTPQTVLDTEQMLLRHHRISGHEMPRRYQQHHQKREQSKQAPFHLQPPPFHMRKQHLPGYLSPTDVNTDPPNLTEQNITKSNTADEVNESKQMLFRKHIGDHRNNKNFFRHKNFRKDPSDDNLSSNYPNSSRSTVRDMTWSSISSAVASNSAIYEDVETSWKETEPDLTGNVSLAPSDSFEYDNSMDRLRIQKMEHLWSLPEKDLPSVSSLFEQDPEPLNHNGDDHTNAVEEEKKIDEFFNSYQLPIAGTSGTGSKYACGYYWPECDNFPETDYGFALEHPIITKQQICHSVSSPINGRKSEPRTIFPTTDIENPTPSQKFQPNRLVIPVISRSEQPKSFTIRPTKVLFNPTYTRKDDDRSSASTLQSNLSGYTNEYLAKARRFGTVVTALRKPGHHIGPAKNPECQCEHCRRWMEERTAGNAVGFGRGRAYSTGDKPTFRTSDFWLSRHTDN